MVFIKYEGDVEKRVREIHDCVSCRYKEYPISLSMGIALYPENGDDYEDIYKHADQALYSAKNLVENNTLSIRNNLIMKENRNFLLGGFYFFMKHRQKSIVLIKFN